MLMPARPSPANSMRARSWKRSHMPALIGKLAPVASMTSPKGAKAAAVRGCGGDGALGHGLDLRLAASPHLRRGRPAVKGEASG